MKGGGATRAGGADPRALSSNPDAPFVEDELAGISVEELREFLEADQLEVPADPGFKERLRRKLWDLVLARAGKSLPEDD